jgi:hypothetical protein
MGLIHTRSMHRLTARLLLFFALVGNLAPLVLAATTPAHACCVRKAVHHCHDSLDSEQVSEAGQLTIRDAGACNHDCCRAVTTARWAHAQPPAAISFAQQVEAYLDQSNPVSPSTEPTSFESTRAPPHLSRA